MQKKMSMVRAARVAGIYAVAAMAWVMGSDLLTHGMFPDLSAREMAETVRGGFFVAVSAALLFALLCREEAKRGAVTDKMQRHDALLRSVLDCSDDMIFVKDREGRIVYMNPAGYRMCGLKPEQVIGRTAAESHGDAAESARFMADDRRVMESGRTETVEEAFTTANGVQHVCLTTKAPRLDEAGRVIGLVGISHEITERKRAEEALRWSETQLAVTLEATADGILSVDNEGRMVKTNRRFAELWRIPQPLLDRGDDGSLLNFVLDQLADPQAFLSRVQALYGTETVATDTVAFKDGRLFERYSSPMLMAGRVAGRVWSFRDITARKQSDEKLRASEERHRKLFEEATEGIALADATTGELLDCNQAFLHLTGYDRAGLIGRPQKMLHPAEDGIVTRNFLQHCGEKNGEVISERMVTRSGAIKQVEIKANTIEMDGRHVLLGFFRDVTAEARYERERETTLDLLRLLNDNNHTHELVRSLADFLHEWTGCEAVGIRLREGGGFPYFETRGFPPGFVKEEHRLCMPDPDAAPARDDGGRPARACVCGRVLRGHFDPARPFFTAKGSFWTNSARDLLAAARDGDGGADPDRLLDNGGYESVGLFALRHGGETLGLLEIKDRDRNRFSHDMLAFLERAADQIAMALSQRRTQSELRASEERYRLLADNAEDFVALNDTQGHRLYVSPSYHRVTGWRPEDDATADWTTRVHADDLPVLRRSLEANLAGEATTIEHRIRCSDGSWIWVEARCKPLRGQDGRVEHLLLWSHDITRRKQAEEGLIRLATVVEQATECIVITDTGGVIQYVNPAFERTTGYTRAEAIGLNPRILKSGKQEEGFYREMWTALARGEVWRGHFSNKRKDGALYEEEATISPVRNAAGQIVNYVAIKRDVTEQAILRQQLLQAQKMETIGQLAGGVAHDFNNLLQAILGYNEIILGDTPPDDSRRADLLEIQKTGRRAAELTRQLLALGRKQNLDRRVTDVNALIEDFSKMLRRVIGENIRIEFDLAPNLERVLVDHGQIGQVLLNLAVNARDAMPRGGRLLFKTDLRTFEAGDLVAQPDVRSGRFVCISVSDTGTGMPPEVLEKLFEPFFTTKGPGKGTGLGLATSYGIARQHDGWMDAYSELGNGSSFKLYLPVIETAGQPLAPGAPPPPPPEALRGGGQHILFVEDEDVIRTMIKRQLERNGYRVTAVADATAAVDRFVRDAGAFDLVLTDVVLPDVNGLELLEDLLARKPGLRVLISSGYTDNEKRWPVILERKWPFIGKPYTSAELLTALHRILPPA